MTYERNADVPVFILAGGLGTRMGSETELRPKPMVEIGGKPIIWHIMKKYSNHGFKRFIVCAGYKGNVLKEYFYKYATMSGDVTIRLDSGHIDYDTPEEDWHITIADTGELCQGGGRVARAADKYIGHAQDFAVTYGDGLADVDLGAEFRFHKSMDTIGTVLGVNMPSRFGEFILDDNNPDFARKFQEKPSLDGWINGGYFFFKREFLSHLEQNDGCVLEGTPMMGLAEAGQLAVYKHRGFWQCMDTQRERDILEKLWLNGDAPWAR